MRPVHLSAWLGGLVLAAAGAAPAAAFEPLGAPFAAANPALRPAAPPTLPSAAPGRSPVTLPPAYAAPARGAAPLPSSGAPLVFPGYTSPSGEHVWVSGRTEPTFSLGADGRIIHGLEHVPGRFERRSDPPPDRP
jgi:hypothetical protein